MSDNYSTRPPLNLLLLRFSSFYTNSPDFKDRFGRLGIPVPESFLHIFPDRVPRVSISLPAEADLQQVTNILLRKHQEGVC